jgi:hypothetical protein
MHSSCLPELKLLSCRQRKKRKSVLHLPKKTVSTRKRQLSVKQIALDHASNSEDVTDSSVGLVKKRVKRTILAYVFTLLWQSCPLTMSCRWSKPENHYLSDELIGLIEDHPTWKVTFGFDKGTDESVATGGKKNIAHCHDITKKLFAGKTGSWDDANDAALTSVVKNCITV